MYRMREVGSLIQETGSIRNPQITLTWDISHLAAIGDTSAIAKCSMARSADRRGTTSLSRRCVGFRCARGCGQLTSTWRRTFTKACSLWASFSSIRGSSCLTGVLLPTPRSTNAAQTAEQVRCGHRGPPFQSSSNCGSTREQSAAEATRSADSPGA
jgi:hypothetical protein